MTLLYHDPRFLLHETKMHPESARRLVAIGERLEADGLAARCGRPEWEPIEPDTVGEVHDASHLGVLQALADKGGGWADPDTRVSAKSVDIALLAAGACADAARRIVAGEDNTALCLVRPPGHHALANQAMGFCLLGNAAFAARAAQAEGVGHILIVDWDVHHGNGTQALFYEDPSVGFFSIHRWPFYPGTGSEHETGTGDGLGTTLNEPVQFGTSRRVFRERFLRGLEDMAGQIKPDLIILSAGFDAHRLDPVGSLGLEEEDFVLMTSQVLDLAASCCGGRVLSILEGGYDPQVLSDCVSAHLTGLLDSAPTPGKPTGD